MSNLLETFLHLVWWKQDPITHFPMVEEGEGEPVGRPVNITNYAQSEDLKKWADVRMNKIVRGGLHANAFQFVEREPIDTQVDITIIQPCWVP